MRIMRQTQWLHALLLATFLLATIWRPIPVFACSCAYDPTLTDAERVSADFARDFNEIVFVGTVQKTKLARTNPLLWRSDAPVYVTFTVERVYKGNVGEEFTLSTAMDSASCGYAFYEEKRYLVFVGDLFGDGSLDSGLCSGNVEEPTAVLLNTLGEGYAPSAFGNNGSLPGNGVVTLAVGVIVLAAGGWWLWVKKRGSNG